MWIKTKSEMQRCFSLVIYHVVSLAKSYMSTRAITFLDFNYTKRPLKLDFSSNSRGTHQNRSPSVCLLIITYSKSHNHKKTLLYFSPYYHPFTYKLQNMYVSRLDY